MKHLAGIIPVSGVKSDFNMPWHESLMPIAPGYLAVERAVVECAYAGCDTIWIVCGDDVEPLIRYQVGEVVQDPVYNYRHFERNKQEVKRPIRIYYVPIKIRDINKRDNLAWSAIHGAQVSNKILGRLSHRLAPEKFWISWPYGFSYPSNVRNLRQDIAQKNIMLAYQDDTVMDNAYLGFSLNIEQIKQLITESKTRSTGLWKDPENRGERHSLDERYSYKNFDLKKVFETLDRCSYNVVEVGEYYNLDNWKSYCSFLNTKSDLTRPKLLTPSEWNEIGFDE